MVIKIEQQALFHIASEIQKFFLLLIITIIIYDDDDTNPPNDHTNLNK